MMNQLAVHPQWSFLRGMENNFRNLQIRSMDDSLGENSSSSRLCSLDTTDDASSSSPTPCSSNGPLPIRRGGLSQFYNGKSESFTSLSMVTSVQDLPKKETPYTRRMKGCKSGLDAYKSYTSPTPTITKKISPSSSSQNRSFISSKRIKPPLVPVKENHP